MPPAIRNATVSHAIVLGDFLRAKRAALDIATVELPTYGQRRVPGLRREEVALLAGISTSYYTRIEQGAVTSVSSGVLDAISRAMNLDTDERAHLYRLAGQAVPFAGRATAGLHPRLEVLLHSVDWLPVGVLGSGMQVLGWNRMCHLVFADHLAFDAPWTHPPVNWAHLLFTDPQVKGRFPNWDAVAFDIAGRLRTSQSHNPSNAALTALIHELADASEDFVRLWDTHPARDAPLGEVVVRHPTLGDLHLTDVTLRPTDSEEALVIIFLSEPGSATERTLRAAVPGTSSSPVPWPGQWRLPFARCTWDPGPQCMQ